MYLGIELWVYMLLLSVHAVVNLCINLCISVCPQFVAQHGTIK